MLTVPTRYPEQDASIFVFQFEIFFFNISISTGRTGERDVSIVPTRCPEQDTIIFVFVKKNFLRYLDFWRLHR